MRLFVAVDPPEEALDAVDGALAAAPGPALPLRWTARADRHITLCFLGDVPDRRYEGLCTALSAEARRHAAFRIALRGVGTFPGDDRAARVLWAGAEGGTSALGRLAAALAKTARRCGQPADRRAFVPHLTLARSAEPADLADLRTALAALASPFWNVGAVHLAESVPGAADGARYRTLRTWELAQGADNPALG